MGQTNSSISENNKPIQFSDKQLDENVMKIFKSYRSANSNDTQLVSPLQFDSVTSSVAVDTINTNQTGGNLQQVAIIPKRQRYSDKTLVGGADPSVVNPVVQPKNNDQSLSNNDLQFIKDIVYQTKEKVDKFGLQGVEYLKKTLNPIVGTTNEQVPTVDNFSATSPEYQDNELKQDLAGSLPQSNLDNNHLTTINKIKNLIDNTKNQQGGSNVLSDDELDIIRGNLAKQGVVKSQTGGALDNDLVDYKNKILNNQCGGDAEAEDDSSDSEFDSNEEDEDEDDDDEDSESEEDSDSDQAGGKRLSSSTPNSSDTSSVSSSSDLESSSDTDSNESTSSSSSSDFDDITDGHHVIMQNSMNKQKNKSKYLQYNGYKTTSNEDSRLRNLYNSSESVSDNLNYVRNRNRSY